MTKFHLCVMLQLLVFFSPEFYCRYVDAQSASESPPSPYGLDSKIDPEMAIIVVVVVCSFFLMGFFSIYLRHCTESRSVASGVVNHKDLSRCGLDRTVIDAFPVFTYIAVKDLRIGTIDLECAVCFSEFEDFEDFETLRLLPKCNHVFHAECVDAWLNSHVTCPVCRANLTPESAKPQEKTEPNHELHELNSETQYSEIQIQNQVSITINDDENQDQNRLTETETIVLRKFPRSHSTGHSLSQPENETERFTLRLPEEVRNQIMASGNKLKRSTSYDVVWVNRNGSSRGKSCVDRRSNWWVFSMTPAYLCREDSGKGLKVGDDREKDLRPVHSPVYLLS